MSVLRFQQCLCRLKEGFYIIRNIVIAICCSFFVLFLNKGQQRPKERKEEMHLLLWSFSNIKNGPKTAGHSRYPCCQKGKILSLFPFSKQFSSNALFFFLLNFASGMSVISLIYSLNAKFFFFFFLNDMIKVTEIFIINYTDQKKQTLFQMENIIQEKILMQLKLKQTGRSCLFLF